MRGPAVAAAAAGSVRGWTEPLRGLEWAHALVVSNQEYTSTILEYAENLQRGKFDVQDPVIVGRPGDTGIMSTEQWDELYVDALGERALAASYFALLAPGTSLSLVGVTVRNIVERAAAALRMDVALFTLVHNIDVHDSTDGLLVTTNNLIAAAWDQFRHTAGAGAITGLLWLYSMSIVHKKSVGSWFRESGTTPNAIVPLAQLIAVVLRGAEDGVCFPDAKLPPTHNPYATDGVSLLRAVQFIELMYKMLVQHAVPTTVDNLGLRDARPIELLAMQRAPAVGIAQRTAQAAATPTGRVDMPTITLARPDLFAAGLVDFFGAIGSVGRGLDLYTVVMGMRNTPATGAPGRLARLWAAVAGKPTTELTGFVQASAQYNASDEGTFVEESVVASVSTALLCVFAEMFDPKKTTYADAHGRGEGGWGGGAAAAAAAAAPDADTERPDLAWATYFRTDGRSGTDVPDKLRAAYTFVQDDLFTLAVSWAALRGRREDEQLWTTLRSVVWDLLQKCSVFGSVDSTRARLAGMLTPELYFWQGHTVAVSGHRVLWGAHVDAALDAWASSATGAPVTVGLVPVGAEKESSLLALSDNNILFGAIERVVGGAQAVYGQPAVSPSVYTVETSGTAGREGSGGTQKLFLYAVGLWNNNRKTAVVHRDAYGADPEAEFARLFGAAHVLRTDDMLAVPVVYNGLVEQIVRDTGSLHEYNWLLVTHDYPGKPGATDLLLRDLYSDNRQLAVGNSFADAAGLLQAAYYVGCQLKSEVTNATIQTWANTLASFLGETTRNVKSRHQLITAEGKRAIPTMFQKVVALLSSRKCDMLRVLKQEGGTVTLTATNGAVQLLNDRVFACAVAIGSILEQASTTVSFGGDLATQLSRLDISGAPVATAATAGGALVHEQRSATGTGSPTAGVDCAPESADASAVAVAASSAVASAAGAVVNRSDSLQPIDDSVSTVAAAAEEVGVSAAHTSAAAAAADAAVPKETAQTADALLAQADGRQQQVVVDDSGGGASAPSDSTRQTEAAPPVDSGAHVDATLSGSGGSTERATATEGSPPDAAADADADAAAAAADTPAAASDTSTDWRASMRTLSESMARGDTAGAVGVLGTLTDVMHDLVRTSDEAIRATDGVRSAGAAAPVTASAIFRKFNTTAESPTWMADMMGDVVRTLNSSPRNDGVFAAAMEFRGVCERAGGGSAK